MQPPCAEEMSPEAALRLDDVDVRYRIALDVGLSIKEWIVRRRKRRVLEHEALRGITLEVGRGETVGVIGSNGAGKTTLLKVISRLLDPSAGRIRVRGTVAPLVDLLGAIQYELTGRDNAYLAGALLGIRRNAMRSRIDEIESFADLGQFFDAPLRAYSVGMLARLAFATATSVGADILLIDEALAVGDASFAQKSAARLDQARRRGVTTILVSHDVMRLAEMCDRIVWLHAGRIHRIGGARDVVREYLQFAIPAAPASS